MHQSLMGHLSEDWQPLEHSGGTRGRGGCGGSQTQRPSSKLMVSQDWKRDGRTCGSWREEQQVQRPEPDVRFTSGDSTEAGVAGVQWPRGGWQDTKLGSLIVYCEKFGFYCKLTGKPWSILSREGSSTDVRFTTALSQRRATSHP